MKISLDTVTLDLTPSGTGYAVTLDGTTYPVEIIRAENGQIDFRIRLEDASSVRASAYVSKDGAKRWVTIDGRTFLLTKSAGASRSSHTHHAAGELIAPMPGQVRAVNVSEGDAVTKGQTLLILEAMKMEIKVVAPRDGVVKSVAVKIGQTVEREQILATLER
jgi:biotin carboxyl carrier protein